VVGPTITTIKKLFSLTRNRCAFPGCTNPLINASGVLIGEVCHICADNPGGKRYDPHQTEAERQAFSNLIALCANHHKVIDGDDVAYTVAALQEMKRQHEAKATKPFVISDDLTARIVAFMAGATLARGLVEIAREIDAVIKAIAEVPPSVKKSPKEIFVEELLQTLRFAPKGVIQHFAVDPAHLELAVFFSRIFKSSGWRDLGRLEFDPASKTAGRSELVLVFSLSDPHQISNAKQAIDAVFAKCGFIKTWEDDQEAYESAATGRLRVLLMIGTRR
jgi:hypothetical protein